MYKPETKNQKCLVSQYNNLALPSIFDRKIQEDYMFKKFLPKNEALSLF